MTIRQEAFAGKPIPCRVIDAHTHIGPYHMSGWHQKYDRTDISSTVKDMERMGIDCIVTAPHLLVQGRMKEANEFANLSAHSFPGKIYGYISIVPARGMQEVKNELRTYEKNPYFIGLKFLPGFYHGDLLCPEYEYALDFAEEMSCPVLCHEYDNSPDRQDFVKILDKRHNLKLIIAHQGGGFAADTRDCAPIIRNYENAYMELCGSIDNSYSVDEIVEMVGENKVIFGTDAISIDAKYELGKVAFSLLSDEIKKKIFSENYLELTKNSQMGKIIF